MPIHIRARPEDVAERVIIVGDPARAEQLAQLLNNARLVNENRGLISYTGYYGETKITIATHGIGAPSAAIAIEELIQVGAKIIIRLGTTGAVREEIGLGDVVIPTGAAYNAGGIYAQYLGTSIIYPAIPNHAILTELIQNITKTNIKTWIGPIYSSDAFYAEENITNTLSTRGILSIEMETAILYLLGLVRGVKTGAVLIVSNNLTQGRDSKYLTAEELKPIVEKIGRAVINALTNVKP